MSDSEARLRAALRSVAGGAPLDEALGSVAGAVVDRFGAATCKIWLVKAGDLCRTCALARTCENRDMCLHLTAGSGTPAGGPQRVPLVVFRDRVTARGGGARLAESAAGDLLFGSEREANPDAEAFATIPLTSPAGVIGLIGMLTREPVPIAAVEALRGFADAATLAIRIADLTSRCQRAKLKLEETAGERAEVGALLHAILYGSIEYNVIAEDLEGRVTLFSEGARNTYGYEPQEVIGRASADALFAPEELQSNRVVEILDEAMRTGMAEAVVTRIRKNGERFPARATFTVRRDEDGDPCGFVVVERDLSKERSSARLTETTALQLALAQEHLRELGASHALLEENAARAHDETERLRGSAAAAERLEAALADALRTADEQSRGREIEAARAATLARQVDDLIARLETIGPRVAELEAAEAGLLERLEAADRDVAAARAAAEESDHTADELREQLAALRSHRRQVESERDLLAGRAAAWEEERGRLVAERERLLAHRDNRILELEALLQREAASREDELSAELEAAGSDLATAIDRARRAESRSVALEGERDALRGERDALGVQISQLSLAVRELSDESVRSAGQARDRDGDAGQMQLRLETELDAERRRADAAVAGTTALEARLRTLEGRCEALEVELAAARALPAGPADVSASGAVEQSNRSHESRARLLADMSHELRSPMNAIIGYTTLVLEDRVAVPEHHRETLRKVERNARDLLHLINNVLDLSKMEAGKMELFPEAVDLADLAANARSVVEPQIAGRQIELMVDVPREAAELVTDRTKLQQILVNLLTNAVKFTPFGKVSARASAVGDRVVVAVVDTGVGIGEEHLSTIFEEYRQVGPIGGTGLGLPISRRLARLLGGELTVASRPGWGSTFTLTIPRVLASRDSGVPEREALAAGAILVLAGEPNEAFLVAKYLREAKRPAVVVEESSHAFRLLDEAAPALAIVDVTAERGRDLLDALAERGLPAVAIGPAAERGRSFGRAARAFVARPIERLDLIRAVGRVASGSRPRLLIIDDEEDARDLMARMVGRGDFEVDVVSGWTAAVERLRAGRPDLIVLDLMMPHKDGFEVVNQLNAEAEWRDIPILLVTAKDLTPAERKALGSGVRRVMRKGDLNREEILAEIDRAVNAR